MITNDKRAAAVLLLALVAGLFGLVNGLSLIHI